MAVIPLGIGSYRRASGFVPEVVLRNLYLEKDQSGISPDNTLRIQRPGLTRIASVGAYPIEGLHYRTSTGERLAVSAGTFYVNEVASGMLGNLGRVAMVSTPFASLIVSGGDLYIWDTVLTGLQLPDDAPSNGYVQDVDQLNGYGIVLQPNGRFYWIVPGQTTIDPLNYATAESLPDKAKAVRRLGDEFWIFGDENVEVWQATGDLDAPFQRANGRNYERGCLYRDAVRRFDNTLVWIGDDNQVYRGSSVPQVISDSGIAERIRRAAGDCSATTFGIDGHSFYVLTIPGQGTFAYDAATQAWSEFSTAATGGWIAQTGYQVNGSIIMGSGLDGRLFRVDANAFTDDGAAFERAVTGLVAISGKRPRNDSLSVGVGASDQATIRIRWRDGQDDYPAVYEEVDAFAPYDIATIWRLGMPEQPYREVEVSCVDPVGVRFSGMMANEAWR